MENRDVVYEIWFQVLIIGMHISPAYLFLFLCISCIVTPCLFFHLLLS
jgi:hypothetical protein